MIADTMTVPAELIERHAAFGWGDSHGEWGVINGVPRAALRCALDRADEPALESMLSAMFRRSLTNGLVSYHSLADTNGAADLAGAIDYNIRLWRAYTDETDIAILATPSVGQPLTVEVDGVDVTLDMPRHDHYAHRLRGLLPYGGTVLEIGGGFGGCALQLLRRSPDIRVVICDIPETLYLALYWLRKATSRTVGWWDTDPDADIVLLPSFAARHWTDTDIVFAAHSLSEMDAGTVAGYMDLIANQWCPSYLFHDSAHTPGEQPDAAFNAWPETPARDMAPDGYTEVYRAQTVWYGTGNRYWEFLYKQGNE